MVEPPQHSGVAGWVVVVGAGRMGADIALAFVLGGWRCDVVDTGPSARDTAAGYWDRELRRLRKRRLAPSLRIHAQLANAVSAETDLLIESVPENLAAKRSILTAAEALMRPGAILASNTSSLRIGDVAAGLKRPQRFVGMHFGVPAHVTLAVEVTRGERTAPATLRKAVAWLDALGKVPVVLRKDVPGMIINRLQHAMYREIYHLIDTGVATAADIDKAVRFGFGAKYPIAGPVVSRDIHGLPVHLAVARQIYPTLHNGSEPGEVLQRLVAQGHHGVRTGKGFYTWNAGTVDARMVRFTELLEKAVRGMERRNEPAAF